MDQTIDIGIEEDARRQIAEGLARLLADTYTLYVKTHGFHWNVTGPMFQELHLMFEKQYQELAEAVDTIAERIRALGFFAPSNFKDFQRLTSIKENASAVPNANDMVLQLVHGHEAVIRTARTLVPIVDGVNDEATLDLLTERTREHEKTAWMLRSLIQSQGIQDLI
jgi:starvation-inducible DNA-binding protein